MTHLPARLIADIYKALVRHHGALNWWPADTPFEVAVGAILTQNTAWTHVERALDNLKQAAVLSPSGLATISPGALETLVRPAGYFRLKARRLGNFSRYLVRNFNGDMRALCDGPLPEARQRLLDLEGIGPETADSILLYAGDRPSFVVDAYTRRIFQRIGLLQGHESYGDVQQRFMQDLPHEAALYNDYHAQIVQLAKTCCRKSRPSCTACPVSGMCAHAEEKQQRNT